MVESGTDQDLMAEEDRLWADLHECIDSLPEDEVATPGYFPEGWSAKDLVAHLGSWLAAAGAALGRIRFGTYRPEEIDIDALNERFYTAMKDVPFRTVRAQAVAARTRMLTAWGALQGTDDPEAERGIRKAGPEHYAEHLPRLREWAEELRRG